MIARSSYPDPVPLDELADELDAIRDRVNEHEDAMAAGRASLLLGFVRHSLAESAADLRVAAEVAEAEEERNDCDAAR